MLGQCCGHKGNSLGLQLLRCSECMETLVLSFAGNKRTSRMCCSQRKQFKVRVGGSGSSGTIRVHLDSIQAAALSMLSKLCYKVIMPVLHSDTDKESLDHILANY